MTKIRLGRNVTVLLAAALSGLLLTALAAPEVSAADIFDPALAIPPGQYCNDSGARFCEKNYICKHNVCVCAWGKLEVGLLSFPDDGRALISAGDSICDLVKPGAGGLRDFIEMIIIGMMVLTVMSAMISVVIGGYIYMTAGGNADRVRTAKIWIGSAILGVALAVLGWLILSLIAANLV